MSTSSEPSISAPKGGGAVSAINEFFRPDLFTGTGNCSIPIACSHGRAGFGPQPTLQYSTGLGNSPFGLGWDLGSARISRRTDKGVPRYSDDDTFTLTGADDLVPVCDAAGTTRVVPRLGYDVTRFRPRRESTFSRIERWRRTADGDTHWRVTSRENVTSIFGRSPVARLDDGGDPARVWSWLLDEAFDAAGNHIKYEYAHDAPGQDRSAPFEARRSYRQRYLRRIFFGNLASVLHYPGGAAVGPARSGTHHLQYDQPVTRHYVFELLFDYGDLPPLPGDPYVAPPPGAESFSDVAAAGVRVAPVRSDPFSSYRSGFELRTLRRCTRALMFHHLQELGGPTLVRSTDFDYDADGHSGTSRLIRVHTRGYARDNAGYAASSLPPIALAYSDFDPSRRRYQSLAVARGEGPSRSVSHPGQVILDAYGDGLPDVVQWTASGIRVWRNRGGGTLEAPLMMPVQPSHAALGDAGVAIADMDGDTMPDLVVHDRGVRGFYEMTPDAGWQPFQHYHTVPNVSLGDPNVRLLDLTGNGRSDVLVTTPAHFVWFENLGNGFSPPRHIDRIHDLDRFPDLSFAGDPARLRIADMNGDGLPDLVLLHEGRVDYWPSLGYGRFGPRVTMANAPRLAWPFDPRRVMLADLDGSGCADLVYVHGDHVDYWFNRSGNAWSEKAVVPGTPPLVSPDDLVVADVFGSGTATLVWTYGAGVLAGGNYKALDFCGGIKPNLLVRLTNNVGATMRFTYAPSTKFFLADRDAGRPWVTALPFVVHVIEQTDTIDHIGRFREVSRFAYHHGYYDRREREFRGFGCVERFDTEDQVAAAAATLDDGRAPDNGDAAYRIPPVVTRTWFHTGAYFAEGEQLSARYTREYFSGDPQAFTLPAHDIAADALPAEAVAALRGTQLRAEVYGLDGSAKAGIPYTVSESRYAVRLLQPAGGDAPHSVLQVVVTDEIAHRYERVPDDPRVTHNLVAGVDAYGNVTQQIAIAYPRRAPSAHPEQQEPRIGFTWQQFINADRDDAYRVGVLCDSRRFEIHGAQTTLPASRRWTTGDFATLLADVDRFEPFEATPTTFRKRLLLWSRQYFRRDSSVDVADPPDSTAHRLPWGEIGQLGLPYQTYQAVLTPGLRAQVYGTRVTDADLRRAGYTAATDVVSGAAGRDYWWAGSGRHGHGSPFLRATIVQDAFGSRSAITYDQYDLLPIKTADALNNAVTASNDYRVLQPSEITDANGNRLRTVFDRLGIVVATAEMGPAGTAEGDALAAGVREVPLPQVRQHLATPDAAGVTPADLLGTATTCVLYDFWRFYDLGEPIVACSIQRERHVSDASPGGFREKFVYSDGFSREIQHKAPAEPGLVDGVHQNRRWMARGLKISNNKGLTVRQYQPFFSADHRFELRQVGRSPAAFYDPLGRPICTLHPNGTYEKVRFGSWSQESWDPNDTVLLRPGADPDVAGLVSGYLAAYEPGHVTWFDARIPDRANLPAAAVRTLDQQAAIDAAAHAATPMLGELDALGRVFLMQKSDGARMMATRTVLDFEGARLEIADGGGRTLFTNIYDMAKRLIVDESQDSGQRTIFIDVASHPVFVWDAEGRRSRMVYDQVSRRAETWVAEAVGERLVERTVFGEAITNPALLNNHKGRAWTTWDGAGQSIVDAYDFKGSPTQVRRRLLKDPTVEAAWNPAGSANFDQAHADGMLEPASATRVTTSEFDAMGRPLTRTLPDGSTARCSYGVAQLVGVSLATAHGTSASVDGFEHDAHGLRTRMRYGPEGEVTFAYDADMKRLVAMRATRAVTSTPEHICDITYTYDAVGNVTHLRDAGADAPVFANQTVSRDCAYRYDALYRLCEATGREHGSAGSDRPPDDRDLPRQSLPHVNNLNALRRYVETYEYDLAGNLTRVVHDAPGATPASRWTRQYQYASGNRLDGTSLPGDAPGAYSASYQHDRSGQMTRLPHLPSLVWNHAGRLVRVDLAGGGTAYYQYDAAGERVRKAIVNRHGRLLSERITVGPCELHREWRGGAVWHQRETVHLSDEKRRLALVETQTIRRGQPRTSPTGHARYQLADHLGSARFELDAAGRTISYEEYYPYGATSYHAGRSPGALAPRRYRFCAKERDQETGLYYFGARYYAAWLGRWITADPAGREGGLNLFEYCASNPVRLVDPNGLAPLPAHLQNVPDTGLTVASVKEGLADLAALAENETTLREYALVRDGKVIKIIRGIINEVEPAPGQTVIAHTHPNGIPLPTMSDIATMMKQRVGHSLIVTKEGQWAAIKINVQTGAGEVVAASRDGTIMACYEILPEVKWRGKPGDSLAHFRHVADNTPAPKVPPGTKLPGFNPGGSVGSTLAEGAEQLGRSQPLSLWQRFKGVPWGLFGMTALVWLGRIGMAGGAHNEAMRSYENAPGNDDKKSGAYAITFFCTFFAGFVDDSIAATGFAAPVVIDSWEQNGAGPSQVVTGNALRGADAQYREWMQTASDYWSEAFKSEEAQAPAKP